VVVGRLGIDSTQQPKLLTPNACWRLLLAVQSCRGIRLKLTRLLRLGIACRMLQCRWSLVHSPWQVTADKITNGLREGLIHRAVCAVLCCGVLCPQVPVHSYGQCDKNMAWPDGEPSKYQVFSE
jgi:hypothetical protein